MCNLKKPSKIYIIRPNIKVQAAESHISLGLMNGFLEIDLDCQIISGIKFLPKNRKNILIIDDLANYRSENDIKNISKISKEGAVVALWVHWPILKSAKYFAQQVSPKHNLERFYDTLSRARSPTSVCAS